MRGLLLGMARRLHLREGSDSSEGFLQFVHFNIDSFIKICQISKIFNISNDIHSILITYIF